MTSLLNEAKMEKSLQDASREGCLLKRMRKSNPFPSKIVIFPGTQVNVEIRILSSQAVLDSSIEADLYYQNKKVKVGTGSIDDYLLEKTTQQLFRACKEPGTDNPIAENIDEFRRLLSDIERDFFIEHYNLLRESAEPEKNQLSQTDKSEIAGMLSTHPNETIAALNVSQMSQMILHLVNGKEPQ